MALFFFSFRVPWVTYEIEKSLITSPLSSLRSPSEKLWCGGCSGVWAKTALPSKANAKTPTPRIDLDPMAMASPLGYVLMINSRPLPPLRKGAPSTHRAERSLLRATTQIEEYSRSAYSIGAGMLITELD